MSLEPKRRRLSEREEDGSPSETMDLSDQPDRINAEGLVERFSDVFIEKETHIDKGTDLIEEASMLTQSGNFGEATGVKDVSRTLKRQMQMFTTSLEETREQIEDTAKCYQLLDQAYGWALDTMKKVSTIKIEPDSTPLTLHHILINMDSYIKRHPFITQPTFDEMSELSGRLGSSKLKDQCRLAISRCTETEKLWKMRRETIKKAKESFETMDKHKSPHRSFERSPSIPRDDEIVDMYQRFKQTSTPLTFPSSARRRSYAGVPSAPMLSPAEHPQQPSFPTIHSPFSESEENLNLITKDMSQTVVASFPNAKLRGSRDSLTGSRESLGSQDSLHNSRDDLHSSSESLTKSEKSRSLPRELLSSVQSTLSKHNKPLRKMFKRSNTASELRRNSHDDPVMRRKRNNDHKGMFGYLTRSSESLPSMLEEVTTPEESSEDDDDDDKGSKCAWSPVPVNSHLMRQAKTLTHHSSMTDLRMTETEIKSRRILAHVMEEMIQTERDYVRSLQYVIENYIPTINYDEVPQSLRGKRNVIFGNIEKIHLFHSQSFLRELEQCNNAPFQVCHCFLAHEHQFYLYALYNKNKPKSDALMAENGAEYFRTKQRELGDKMDLSSYLLKPVQRMGKYALLLKQIIKECPETEPDFQDLKSAEEMVKFQLRHGNDLLAMDSLRSCDVNLQEQGRLLRQEQFLVWEGKKRCLRHVFLFEDLIVFSKTRRSNSGHDIYFYKNCIKTCDLGLTESVGDSDTKFELWFRKRTRATFTLQAPIKDIKNTWVKEISRLLWQQAFRNRDKRLSDMASMGIGNKPCLDLKPSNDNINDRFVNINLSDKVKTRHSVHSSPGDQEKGQKRPHSIIESVCSSSSSSSSGNSSGVGLSFQNYTGYLQQMGVSFDQQKQPGKTQTVSSNESGICPDVSMDTSCNSRGRSISSPNSLKSSYSGVQTLSPQMQMTQTLDPGPELCYSDV